MDTLITIIIILGMLAAFYSGFFVGYLKRHDKPPEQLPIVTSAKRCLETVGNDIDDIVAALKKKQQEEDKKEPKSYFDT